MPAARVNVTREQPRDANVAPRRPRRRSIADGGERAKRRRRTARPRGSAPRRIGTPAAEVADCRRPADTDQSDAGPRGGTRHRRPAHGRCAGAAERRRSPCAGAGTLGSTGPRGGPPVVSAAARAAGAPTDSHGDSRSGSATARNGGAPAALVLDVEALPRRPARGLRPLSLIHI